MSTNNMPLGRSTGTCKSYEESYALITEVKGDVSSYIIPGPQLEEAQRFFEELAEKVTVSTHPLNIEQEERARDVFHEELLLFLRQLGLYQNTFQREIEL